MRKHVIGACLAALLPLTAQGATTFAEGAGDFSNAIMSPTFLGILDLGLNTVSGSISKVCNAFDSQTFSCTSWGGDVLDFFSFDIGPEQALVAATMTLSNVDAEFSVSLRAGGFTAPDTSPFLAATCLFNPQDDFCGPRNILAEPYATGVQQFGVGVKGIGFVDSGARVNFDWTVSLRVENESDLPPAVIPLPATLPLLLGALGGLVLAARRRKAIA